jgi:hypothetical protein
MCGRSIALIPGAPRRYFMIASGHDMFQFTVLGALLAVWR